MAMHAESEFSEMRWLATFPEGANRLKLVRKLRRVAEAEARDPSEFSRVLGARVPESWPPKFFTPLDGAEKLSWANYYMILTEGTDGPVLVGWSGFALRTEERTLQFGAAFVPEYQGKQLGGDLVSAVSGWAIAEPAIERMICDIPSDKEHAAKALEASGFSKEAKVPAPNFVRSGRGGWLAVEVVQASSHPFQKRDMGNRKPACLGRHETVPLSFSLQGVALPVRRACSTRGSLRSRRHSRPRAARVCSDPSPGEFRS